MPEIRAAFEALVAHPAAGVPDEGSGSALFAVYRSARDREDARMMLGRKHGGRCRQTLADAWPGRAMGYPASGAGSYHSEALALRPTAGQRTLDPLMVVRIHQGQLLQCASRN